MNSRLFTFIGGSAGGWRVANIQTVIGEPLSTVSRIKVTPGEIKQLPSDAKWALRGITSNERYVVRSEQEQLLAKQPSLGRPEATCAALIPVRKNSSWWMLPQDERRRIFENNPGMSKSGFSICRPLQGDYIIAGTWERASHLIF